MHNVSRYNNVLFTFESEFLITNINLRQLRTCMTCKCYYALQKEFAYVTLDVDGNYRMQIVLFEMHFVQCQLHEHNEIKLTWWCNWPMWPMWQHSGMCTNTYISYDICVLYPDDVYIQDLNHEWYATLNTWHLVHMITVDVYPQLPLSHVSEVLLEKGEFEECALTSEFITPGIISRQKFVSCCTHIDPLCSPG